MSDPDAAMASALVGVTAAVASLRPLVSPAGGGVGQVATARSTCLDAADVLGAVAAVLSRPFAPERAPALRRVVEAGLTAAAECAADCRALGDRDEVVNAAAEADEAAATALRALLSHLVDDDVEERSGAT